MSSKRSPLLVLGTRPEVTKLFSVARALRAAGASPVVLSTGQHRELLHSTADAIGLTVDRDLELMRAGQRVDEFLARLLASLPSVLAELRPSVVVVQGDTATAMGAGLCAYYAGIPVAHVEAGLRTYDHANPFPEEMHRQVLGRIARYHLAPTEAARDNLLAERVPAEHIHVTGNTGVDGLLGMLARAPRPPIEGPYVLVTLHRRESFGAPLRNIVRGLRRFLGDHADRRVLWPVHPNPAVSEALAEAGEDPRIVRTAALDYGAFVGALAGAKTILSDSGGVQEEAPTLGKRVLVARESTERPEAVDLGLNWLVGRDEDAVAEALERAWNEPAYGGPIPAPNPYGDGKAGERIAEILLRG